MTPTAAVQAGVDVGVGDGVSVIVGSGVAEGGWVRSMTEAAGLGAGMVSVGLGDGADTVGVAGAAGDGRLQPLRMTSRSASASIVFTVSP